MRMPAAAVALLLAGCDQAPAPRQATGDGARLEAAAIARGVIDDPAVVTPVGLYTSEEDAVCIVPEGAKLRIGVRVDYGEGQRCAARGTASGRDRLAVDLGRDCRFQARLQGEAIAFPVSLPPGCARACEGRASLAALRAVRITRSAAEAAALPGFGGKALCRAD